MIYYNRAAEAHMKGRAESPASGFELSRRVQGTRAAGCNGVRDLYVALRRLERVGLLDGKWRRHPGVQREVRQYHVTTRGLRALGYVEDDRSGSTAFHPLTILVVLAVCGRPNASECAGESRPARLTIVVTPELAIPPQELRQAAMEVHRILGAAGITVNWVFQPPLTPSPRSPAALPADVFIVRATLGSDHAHSSSPQAGEILLGVTNGSSSGREADILLFYEHILEFAAREQRDASRILGLVLAHEIGHALLPKPAHAETGVMQAPWDHQTLEKSDNGLLRFTARQSELMRSRLTQCRTPVRD